MNLTTSPKCPTYFKLDKDTCKCTLKKQYLDKLIGDKKNKKKKKKKKTKKLVTKLPNVIINPDMHHTRCPKGMFYDKQYDSCELNILKHKKKHKTAKNKHKTAKNKHKTAKNRNKTAKNRNKTAKDKHKTAKDKNNIELSESSIKVVENDKPYMDRIMGEFYDKMTRQNNTLKPLTKKKALENINKIASYSPEINKQLVSMKTIARNTIDDCDTFESDNPKIRMKDGRCVAYNNPEVQDLLLTNLSSKYKSNCSKIIAPKQIASNCWFNTMFMTFFISDKGRKFFRFFRQLMIQGVKSDGVPIAKNLYIAFFKLNMAIESVLGSNTTDNNAIVRRMALDMNTNIIIQKIYNSIPTQYRHGIYAKNKAGNPLSYYEAIIRYLGNDSVNILNINSQVSTDKYWGNDWHQIIHDKISKRNFNMPDIIIFELDDEIENDDNSSPFLPNERSNKPLDFEINVNNKSAKYILDSCIIRDVSTQHFASTLTCSNKQFGFDGISFSRLNAFAWKKLINSNKEWTFKGSDTEWNFRDGYQLLFYYRV
jgi:hypothetical protein